jgi:hypothetical protein
MSFDARSRDAAAGRSRPASAGAKGGSGNK